MRLSYEPRQLRRVTAAGEFGRVAVLFGGDSSEREISLLSGNAVLAALGRRGVDAHAFDPRDAALSDLIARRFERVWIALHGPGGEDGTLQGALEYLGVPYTGSGVMGSAIGMDKLRTKRLARAVGVATADFVVLCGAQDFEAALERLKLPLIVKPATQGSSVGMSKVERAAGWGRADFMMDAAGRPLLLEINTVPGMTSHSLVPMAARAIEVDFEELVWRVLETSFTRRPASSPGSPV